MPFLGEVSKGNFVDSCLYFTGKMGHIHPLFKINVITYTRKAAQNLLTVMGKLKNSAESSSEQSGGGRIG